MKEVASLLQISGTQFAAVGSAVVKRARAMGLGRELPTEWFLESVSP